MKPIRTMKPLAGPTLIAGLLLAAGPVGADDPPPLAQDAVLAGEKPAVGLQLNFRGVPLDTVLNYLSQAAGFVIVRDTTVAGTVDLISHQPLDKDEAAELLRTLLNDKGYALLRNGRILRIIRREDAKTHDLPVYAGSNPADVPRSGEVVTQIIPVRHTNAAKLIDTLKPLMPSGAVITANDDSNSLVVTDTQTNINRLMQIIQALDTAVSSILDIKVIPLEYADAQESAEVINKVYETPTQKNAAAQSATNRRMNFAARFRGGGRGGGEESADSAGSDIKQTASYIRAVADQRANAVVVTAPAETIPQIQELVKQLDTPSEAYSTLRVFPLQYADATEIANVIAGLYPDSTSATRTQTNAAGGRFSFRGQPFQAQQESSGGESKRLLAEAKVVAMADTRTNSVIVSASPTTMNDIQAVVGQLDATPANVPTVRIYQLKNADASAAKEILDNMFSDLENSGGTSSRSSTGSSSTAAGAVRTTRTNTNNTGTTGGNR